MEPSKPSEQASGRRTIWSPTGDNGSDLSTVLHVPHHFPSGDLTLLDPERDALNSALATIEGAGGGQAVAAALAVELGFNYRSRRIKLMKNGPALKVDYLTAEASQGHEAMPRPCGLKELVARLQSEYGSDLSAEASNEVSKDAEMVEDRHKGKRVKTISTPIGGNGL
ncbi:hypothetical protein BT93_L2781 [Corymbia citriodora subsp. variegata]|uniref:Uncharacterized protein n=1 Tax=Corymbia citriodora subsp. variegata TaxID=360336 RepID=A0A8T0CLF6_CORYI|nr:hypothetical protein BT93_L2781 [Corymbia citriodora subsp. variegata]